MKKLRLPILGLLLIMAIALAGTAFSLLSDQTTLTLDGKIGVFTTTPTLRAPIAETATPTATLLSPTATGTPVNQPTLVIPPTNQPATPTQGNTNPTQTATPELLPTQVIVNTPVPSSTATQLVENTPTPLPPTQAPPSPTPLPPTAVPQENTPVPPPVEATATPSS